MKLSKKGFEFIESFEGSFPKVYDDLASTSTKRMGMISCDSPVVGTPTIGIGHVVKASWRNECDRFANNFRDGVPLTKKQMYDLFQETIPTYERPLREKLKVPVTQAMWDAMVSLSFNAGPNSSALKNAIEFSNQKKWKEASQAIANGPIKSKGKVLQGLVRRRNAEAELFLSQGAPSPLPHIILVSSVALLLGSIIYTQVKK